MGILILNLVPGDGRLSFAGPNRDSTYEALKLFTDVLQEIEESYVDEVDGDTLIENAIKGMIGNLDPHSIFMPPEAFDELQDDTRGEFGGIGIVISIKKGLLTVVSPIEGTPAYRSGIMAGDVIIAIDGESTSDLALWESVKKMRGPTGESVVITIVRDGEPEPLEYKLVRAMIPINSVRSAMVEPGYGYVWVTNFRNNTSDEIIDALDRLESEADGMKGLILDLRNNPGGLLSQAVEVSDIFLQKGVIVSIKGRLEQNSEVFEARSTANDLICPMVVIINSGSASASEIVAGALQDHKRALIIGTTSFGKGSVQTLKPLRNGFGLKYTIARYYTPSGRSIQAEGIIPDIEVPYRIMEKPEKKDTRESPMARLLREKDLKHHLESEKKDGDPKNSDPKNSDQDNSHDLDPEKIDTDQDKSQDNSGKKTEPGRNETDESDMDDQESSASSLIDVEKLKQDYQVQRALDILIGYDLFSALK
ncbi:MAG: S41 family peptidase [Desulfamplus sp.]|nr:S41 family peptidase [Desulfamplus sp.]